MPKQKRGRQQSGGKQKQDPLEQIANQGVAVGIDAFIKAHPRFMNQQSFLSSYVDNENVNKYLTQSMQELQKKYGEKVDPQKLVNTLAGYVNSGVVFNEKGKKILLGIGKSRSWFSREPKEIREGQKYLNKVLGSFKDLKYLLSSNEYAQNNPNLVKAVAGIYNLGFTNSAIDSLSESGALDKSKYRTLKRAIVDRVKQGKEDVIKYMEQTVLPQKQERESSQKQEQYASQKQEKYKIPEKVQRPAAALIGGMGIVTILSTNSITGNVIGVTKTSLTPLLLGIGLLIAGIWLGFRKK